MFWHLTFQCLHLEFFFGSPKKVQLPVSQFGSRNKMELFFVKKLDNYYGFPGLMTFNSAIKLKAHSGKAKDEENGECKTSNCGQDGSSLKTRLEFSLNCRKKLSLFGIRMKQGVKIFACCCR